MESSLPVFDWLTSIARQSGAFQIGNSDQEISVAGSAVRWDYRFTMAPTAPAGPPFDLLVEARSRLSPQLALEVLPRLRQGAGDAVPALCCPVISERVAAMCREAQVSYFDADGNAHIQGRGFFLHISGRPQRYQAESITISDAFAPKSSRVVRALLSAPGRAWGVLELGRASRISSGLASRVKDVLVKEAFLEQAHEGLRVRRPRELLEAWQARYRPPASIMPLYMMGTPQEAETRISTWCDANGVPYALAMFSGAWRVAPMVRYNRATVYLDASASGAHLKSLLQAIEAKPADTGANVAISLVDDSAIFQDARAVGAVRVVSPIQLYLDLSRQAARGEEAAREIFERELAPLFGQAPVREGT